MLSHCLGHHLMFKTRKIEICIFWKKACTLLEIACSLMNFRRFSFEIFSCHLMKIRGHLIEIRGHLMEIRNIFLSTRIEFFCSLLEIFWQFSKETNFFFFGFFQDGHFLFWLKMLLILQSMHRKKQSLLVFYKMAAKTPFLCVLITHSNELS